MMFGCLMEHIGLGYPVQIKKMKKEYVEQKEFHMKKISLVDDMPVFHGLIHSTICIYLEELDTIALVVMV